jgi:hypothetical protein
LTAGAGIHLTPSLSSLPEPDDELLCKRSILQCLYQRYKAARLPPGRRAAARDWRGGLPPPLLAVDAVRESRQQHRRRPHRRISGQELASSRPQPPTGGTDGIQPAAGSPTTLSGCRPAHPRAGCVCWAWCTGAPAHQRPDAGRKHQSTTYQPRQHDNQHQHTHVTPAPSLNTRTTTDNGKAVAISAA